MKFIFFFYLLIVGTSLNANLFEQDAALFRRQEEFNILPVRTIPVEVNDEQLVKRIISAYQLANKPHLGKSMWQLFFKDHHKAIHTSLEKGSLNEITDILRNPGKTDLFYGFDGLNMSTLDEFKKGSRLISEAILCLDRLIRFGEAIGAIKKDNPEAYHLKPRYWDGTNVIPAIEDVLKVTLNFPNPYPDEIGVWTTRGVCSFRTTQALYQAFLIKSYLKNIPNPKVLEIGAGLGRTAYFSRLLGIKDYTIIDIPMTAVCSGYFLGRTLGEDQILLLGENCENPEERVKILTPDRFINMPEQHYDLIINVDSLSEMDKVNAIAYLNTIAVSTPIFISINHEVNPFTVRELLINDQRVKNYKRHYYWMREGYAEEIFEFKE